MSDFQKKIPYRIFCIIVLAAYLASLVLNIFDSMHGTMRYVILFGFLMTTAISMLSKSDKSWYDKLIKSNVCWIMVAFVCAVSALTHMVSLLINPFDVLHPHIRWICLTSYVFGLTLRLAMHLAEKKLVAK